MNAPELPVKIDRGNGLPIVLLHGLGNNYKSWTYVLRHLKPRNRRVIAVDLLGFGDAPKPTDATYDPEQHARAVIATLSSLKLSNALLVGHSMGCIVAIEVAKQRPDLVRGLLLLGAPIYKRIGRASRLKRVLRLENKYFTLFSAVKKQPELMQAGGTIADDMVPFVKGMEITDETWPAYRGSLEHTIMQTQTYKDACNLEVPMLFVNGLLDLFIIRRNTKAIVRQNPKFARIKRVLGPHEITPLHGRRIARLLRRM